jgi:uncharacterized protein
MRGLIPMRVLLIRMSALLCLLLACALAHAQQLAAIPPLDSPVVDTTGTLRMAARKQLEAQALALQQRKGSQLQVLMVASTQPETIEQYTQRAFDAWKLGRKGVDDAVLLVVAKNDRKVRIQPGYGLEGAIPDITAGRVIREYLAPKFRQGDYEGGLVDATAQLVKLIDGEPLPEPMTRQGESGGSGDWLFALFAAFVVAQAARMFLSRLPAGMRGLLGGAASGGIAWLLSSLLLVGGLGALLGFFVGLISGGGGGRYARDRGWGGFGNGPWIGGGGGSGGWGGGGFGGGGGGGWSGGGGMSGGGGASGGW